LKITGNAMKSVLLGKKINKYNRWFAVKAMRRFSGLPYQNARELQMGSIM
jgi:hypothetical protein